MELLLLKPLGRRCRGGLGITQGARLQRYLEAGTHIVDMAHGPLFNFLVRFQRRCELVLAGAGMGATTLVARTHGYDVIHGINFGALRWKLTFARDRDYTQGRIVAIDGLSIEVEITPGFPELDCCS